MKEKKIERLQLLAKKLQTSFSEVVKRQIQLAKSEIEDRNSGIQSEIKNMAFTQREERDFMDRLIGYDQAVIEQNKDYIKFLETL